MAILEARDLHIAFDGMPVLRGVDLQVNEGAHVLVLGPSGSGKSTLLHILARLLPPDAGEIVFQGTPYPRLGPPDRFRLRHLGIVFQEFHLLEALTVFQNLTLVQSACPPERELVPPMELLEPLGIADRAHTPVHVLSRGERQRVALARAFANQPTLILADEPTASLDPSNRTRSMDHLFALCAATGTTALVVSHDAILNETGAFTQVLQMEAGRLVSGASSLPTIGAPQSSPIPSRRG